MKTVMGWVGLDEDTPIENKFITNAITDVQKRVEGYHFDIRKNLVEYDDVVNMHRELIYEERHKILSGADLNEKAVAGMGAGELEDRLGGLAETVYDAHETQMGADKMRLLERLVMLQIIDRLWVEHLTAMENERLQAGWHTLQQMKSADAYKIIGHQRFEELKAAIQHDVSGIIFHVSIQERKANKAPQSPMEKAGIGSRGNSKPNANTGSRKVGRNEPCPCGSGKKYKHCHGR
jgi:preprotein translocase subunit SecA